MVERVERGLLKWNGADRVGLGGLDAVDAEGSADVDQPVVEVDVAVHRGHDMEVGFPRLHVQ